MASGVKLADGCIDQYNELQLHKKYWFVIYKISKECSEIVVDSVKERSKDDSSTASDIFNELREKLEEAATMKEGRYAVMDVHYQGENGSLQTKVAYLKWVPDMLPIKQRMLYASSTDALRKKLTGVHAEVQMSDASDLTIETVISKCKGRI